jgi:uncharacterized protein (DUF433 family)
MLYDHGVMLTLETTQSVPLMQWEDGSIRIAGSRVPIDTILHHYNLGSTPEQIAWKFQGLRTADLYAVIAYYLNNREQIDQYLREREASAEEYWRLLEADREYQRQRLEFRDKLKARWAARQQVLDSQTK